MYKVEKTWFKERNSKKDEKMSVVYFYCAYVLRSELIEDNSIKIGNLILLNRPGYIDKLQTSSFAISHCSTCSLITLTGNIGGQWNKEILMHFS
jgi:hypothetical protein